MTPLLHQANIDHTEDTWFFERKLHHYNKPITICVYIVRTHIIISSIIVYLLHQAQLHVSAVNFGNLQVVQRFIEQLYKRCKICGVFLCAGKGFVWDRDHVCVSGGCMVWNSIISLFIPYFQLCLEWDSTITNKYSCVLTIYTHITMVVLLL